MSNVSVQRQNSLAALVFCPRIVGSISQNSAETLPKNEIPKQPLRLSRNRIHSPKSALHLEKSLFSLLDADVVLGWYRSEKIYSNTDNIFHRVLQLVNALISVFVWVLAFLGILSLVNELSLLRIRVGLLLESCVSATDCGPGFYCGNCPSLGKNQPYCVRGQATAPGSIVMNADINSYFGLLFKNSVLIFLILSFGSNYLGVVYHAEYDRILGCPLTSTLGWWHIMDAPLLPGAQRLTFYNQEDVTNRLRNGVRGFMPDMYDFENDIWLCHSFRGQCYFTGFVISGLIFSDESSLCGVI